MADSELNSLTLLEINEPVIHCWAHTHSKLQKISFTWTINNFSFRDIKTGETINSPTFYWNENDEIKWFMQLYPNGTNESYKGYMSIFLNIEPCNKPSILAKCKLSILNSELKKKETTSFDTRNFKFSNSWGFPEFIKRDLLLDESNDLLSGDKLVILCEVSFVTDSTNISSQKDIGQIEVPECKITDDFAHLLGNQKHSDVTLIVGTHKFPANKAILAARSEVFAAMFEHEMEENKLNIVTINDIDHEVIREMLSFIYTGRVQKLKEFAYQLLPAADKYALERLKAMCEEVLFNELSIETAAEILVLADLHNADQLKSQAIKFFNIHAGDIIKTKGWENIMKPKVNCFPLINEIIEVLLTPTKQRL